MTGIRGAYTRDKGDKQRESEKRERERQRAKQSHREREPEMPDSPRPSPNFKKPTTWNLETPYSPKAPKP